MHSAYLAARPLARRSSTFFRRFLVCYVLGTCLGLLSVRVSWFAFGEQLAALCGSVQFAGRGAWTALLKSGGLTFLVTILLSQLSGRAFWLPVFAGCKAFGMAYVAGAFYLAQRSGGPAWAWLRWTVRAALLLPALYGLSWHCQKARLSGGGRHWFYHRLLPVLLAFGYLPLAAGLEALLCARL